MDKENNSHEESQIKGYYILDMDTDLKLVLSLMLVTFVFIYIPVLNETILRSVVSLAMIFFIPGYALTAALYPGKDDVGDIERIALSFGLNIIISPLILWGLDSTTWGIHLNPIIVCLMTFTILCSMIANSRRHALPKDKRFFIDFGKLLKGMKSYSFINNSKLDKALTVILIVTIILSIASVAYTITIPKHRESFTEFYLKGPDGKAGGFPVSLVVGEQTPVTVGVINEEYRNMTYDLIVELEDNKNVMVLHSEKLALINDQIWEKSVNLTAYHNGTDMKVEFLLYKDENKTSPYRECRLWVNATSPTYKKYKNII